MPKIKSLVTRGFTLVELLVVVALIGILAVAVLSTINPIEQSNRARDAKYKNDAAEIVNAEERYYTTLQKYPWSTAATPFKLPWADAASKVPNVGICDITAGCPTAGDLIVGQELRQEFAARTAFTTTTTADKLFIGRTDQSSGSVYVCFIPASNTTRNTAGTATSKLKKAFTLGNDVPATGPTGCVAAGDIPSGATAWTTPDNACLQCVPE